MYIYHLPFDINKELCRLLDNEDDWEELAGRYMKYSPFIINEIKQEAQRYKTSPTNRLLSRWGQLNHRVEELIILLHKMKFVSAMKILVPLVDKRFDKLLQKHSAMQDKDTAPMDENSNKHKIQKVVSSENSLPIPVIFIDKGEQLPTSSKEFNFHSPTNDSTTDTQSLPSLVKNNVKEDFIKNVSSMAAIPMLSYDDLRDATNNWSDSNLLGRGGFGQVYKGVWKLLPVAVKRLKDNDGYNRELIREMCLIQYRHDNILPLYGYSLGGPEACLVYQLMPGGSLEQRLKCKTAHPPLTWCQRYKIAYGVARGLQYLHTMERSLPLIHGDIKPANILLDQCLMPKIGDFGLARKGPYGEDRTHLKVSKVHGTRYYLPEEYIRSRCLSTSVDVFSFGVVLAEMATVLSVYDSSRRCPLLTDLLQTLLKENADLGALEDRNLKGTPDSNPQLCREFIILAAKCTHTSRRDRPSMLEVYKCIDGLSFPGKCEYI